MATETRVPLAPVEPPRLWFGFAASAASWITLGCLDILITWRACTQQQNFGVPAAHPGVRILFGIVTLVLLLVTIAAGLTSYRNWRALSGHNHVLDAEAVERREFMALLGVIVSITLGMGIIWLALPPLFLDICWRAR
jgi:hypothetical protein